MSAEDLLEVEISMYEGFDVKWLDFDEVITLN